MLPEDMASGEQAVELTVSDFVAVLNQTMEYSYPGVIISGELANLRVSKNRWVYFDLKDEHSSVKFFGTIYQLPGPLEDGMIVRVRGTPKLHNLYGFSVNVSSIQAAGEGSIKRAAELLQAKLTAEGLFNKDRKRMLPYPPQRIGLVASKQSAAYADFMKILDARWRGVTIEHIDVQVQGEVAPAQIVRAIEQFNTLSQPPDVLVLIRGGGSPEDLAAFSTEQVTRAVAASRIPTLVAIGHEVDTCMAELAADLRASTPSNAAELLVPDRIRAMSELAAKADRLQSLGTRAVETAREQLYAQRHMLNDRLDVQLARASTRLKAQHSLLVALSPTTILQRGYALVRRDGVVVRRASDLAAGTTVSLQFAADQAKATINKEMT